MRAKRAKIFRVLKLFYKGKSSKSVFFEDPNRTKSGLLAGSDFEKNKSSNRNIWRDFEKNKSSTQTFGRKILKGGGF